MIYLKPLQEGVAETECPGRNPLLVVEWGESGEVFETPVGIVGTELLLTVMNEAEKEPGNWCSQPMLVAKHEVH